MRIVDLAVPIAPSPERTPPPLAMGVEYFSHADGAAEIEAMLGVPSRLLRDGEGWTRETLTLWAHNSTHVDAPRHDNSTIAGQPAETIDELPLDWFFRRPGPSWPSATSSSSAPAATASSRSPTTCCAVRA